MSFRRRLALAAALSVIAMAAAAVFGLLGLWHLPWQGEAPASQTTAREELAARTPGLAYVIVVVPGGYEAASCDQRGDIDFWSDFGSWREVAKSKYPLDDDALGDSAICGGRDVTVRGARLDDAEHATFIVCGAFSGDGSGWDVVFTEGPDGWRYLTPDEGGLMPVGENVDFSNSVFLSARFLDGRLETATDTGVFNSAFSSEFPLVQYWRWEGTDFALASSTNFTAKATAPPTSAAPKLPEVPPRDGRYGCAIRRIGVKPASHWGLDAQVILTVEPEVMGGRLPYDSTAGPSGPTQVFDVPGTTRVLYPVFTRRGISYITAPAWYVAGLAASNGNGINIEFVPAQSPTIFNAEYATPWYIPSSLGVMGFALDSTAFTAVAKPASAELTFRNGEIVQITLGLY